MLSPSGKEGNPLDWPTRQRIFRGAAVGVAHLYRVCNSKLIHRDIKVCVRVGEREGEMELEKEREKVIEREREREGEGGRERVQHMITLSKALFTCKGGSSPRVYEYSYKHSTSLVCIGGSVSSEVISPNRVLGSFLINFQ